MGNSIANLPSRMQNESQVSFEFGGANSGAGATPRATSTPSVNVPTVNVF